MDLRLTLTLISDAMLALIALFSALMLRLGSLAVSGQWLTNRGFRVCSTFVLVMLFSCYLMEVYNLPLESRKRKILVTCLQAGGAAFFLLSVVYYLNPSVSLETGVFFIAVPLFIVLQFAWHAIYAAKARRAHAGMRVLFFGTGDLARQLGGLLDACHSFALAGYLDYPDSERDSLNAGPENRVPSDQMRNRLIHLNGGLLQTARDHHASMIVVALAERRGVLPLQEMMRCKLDGIEVVDAPTFYEIVQGRLLLEHLTPGSIIFSNGFHRTAAGTMYKRCFDIAIALAGATISAPLIPLIALAIKLDSKGPVFFKQVRVGSAEKPFMLYKFRTMTQEAEEHGAVWARENDARITRVGRFLRDARIDEIPQFYNVLKGDMSFIGPRPERPEFVELLKKEIYYYSKRHTIKPGITGWAQVRYPYGATVQDAAEKLSYDLYYIKNISLFLDSLIILETVKVVLFGRGSR